MTLLYITNKQDFKKMNQLVFIINFQDYLKKSLLYLRLYK